MVSEICSPINHIINDFFWWFLFILFLVSTNFLTKNGQLKYLFTLRITSAIENFRKCFPSVFIPMSIFYLLEFRVVFALSDKSRRKELDKCQAQWQPILSEQFSLSKPISQGRERYILRSSEIGNIF